MYRYENEAVKKFGKIYDRKKDSAELIFPCPKCNSNMLKSNKLYVNTKTGVFHCFRCNYKGKLGKFYDLNSAFNTDSVVEEKINVYSEMFVKYVRAALQEEQKAALYKRGLTDSDIEYYNISGDASTGRILIPNYVIGNLTNMICSWEWRKEKRNFCPKYLYPNILNTNNVLFNIHNIKQNCENVTLCEGVFNAITAGKAAVASYGCHLGDRQLQLLLEKTPKTITIAYDSDIAGVEGAVEVINKLKNKDFTGNVYYILLPKGIDINDMGALKYSEYYEKNKIKIDIKNKLSLDIPKLLFSAL